MQTMKIFVTHHKEAKVLESDYICNVFVGAECDRRGESNVISDRTGDSIYKKRDTYCELTTQYWAWKNVPQYDYYGFSHYRRFLSLSDNKFSCDINGKVIFNSFTDNFVDLLNYTEEAIQEKVLPYDIILPNPLDTKKVNVKNLYDQYKSSVHLNLSDLNKCVDLIKNLTPEYYDSAKKYLEGHIFYPCNMFIMAKNVFNEYCEWEFKILKELESVIDISHYTEEGSRTIGHIAERLLGIFVTKKMEQGLKINVVTRFFVENTDVAAPKSIPIFFVASNEFFPYTLATLVSALNHSNMSVEYDVKIINGGIDDKNESLLAEIQSKYSNLKLELVSYDGLISLEKLHDGAVLKHVAKESYLRLLLLELFPQYDKMIYLDSDLIIQDDLVKLYQIDLGNNYVGAVRAYGVIAEYNRHTTNVVDNFKKMPTVDPYNYFNAGVLLLNLKELRKKYKKMDLYNLIEPSYIYMDQDVLNLACAGKILWIDPRWNVMHSAGGTRTTLVQKYAPLSLSREYFSSRVSPYIIHYAGKPKPWENLFGDYSDKFWNELKGTSLFNYFFANYSSNDTVSASKLVNAYVELGDSYNEPHEADYIKAANWYHQACLLKEGDYNLKYLDACIRTGNPDYFSNAYDFAKARAHRDPRIMSRLGRMYRDGMGVDRDINQAIVCMESALNGGNEWISVEYVDLLIRRGSKSDIVTAFEVTERLSKLGNMGMMYRLAKLYECGIGCKKDLNKSETILSNLVEIGFEPAYPEYVGYLLSKNDSLVDKLAYDIVEKNSVFNLSGLYSKMVHDGRGTSKSLDRAISILEEVPHNDKKIIKQLMEYYVERGSNNDLEKANNLMQHLDKEDI